ncbi:MAG: FKBP-type peptidyl-prolyl cis-trans isomerase, partial [Elusimicrobia bacterium]|nr:FKBP-type peptidyl-prolyl cis-trans isomerase [Elusimicrobiota bacterium]
MAARRALTLAAAALAAAACGRPVPRVEPGALVTLRYSVRADGVPVPKADGPLIVRIGSGDLLPSVEARLMGRRAGEQVDFTLPPDQAFGPRDPAKVVTLPRARFGARAPAVGDTVR